MRRNSAGARRGIRIGYGLRVRSGTEELLAAEYGVDSGEKLRIDVEFREVAVAAGGESGANDGGIAPQSHKENPGVGGKAADFAGGADTVDAGKADVQKNDVGTKGCGFGNGFGTIDGDADDREARGFGEFGLDEFAPLRGIIDNENAYNRWTAYDRLLG